MEQKKKIGKIYKLEMDNKIIYIGSTTNMTRRKYEHKNDCFNQNKSHYNCNLYKIIRKQGIIKENFKRYIKMIWICDVEFTKRYELKAVEAKYITELNPIGNTLCPYGKNWDTKQYYKDNIEKIKQYNKIYREKQQTKIKQIQYFSSSYKFLKYLQDNNHKKQIISGSELYSKYKDWCCNNNHEDILSNTKFGRDIKPYIIKFKSGCIKYDLNTIDLSSIEFEIQENQI